MNLTIPSPEGRGTPSPASAASATHQESSNELTPPTTTDMIMNKNQEHSSSVEDEQLMLAANETIEMTHNINSPKPPLITATITQLQSSNTSSIISPSSQPPDSLILHVRSSSHNEGGDEGDDDTATTTKLISPAAPSKSPTSPDDEEEDEMNRESPSISQTRTSPPPTALLKSNSSLSESHMNMMEQFNNYLMRLVYFFTFRSTLEPNANVKVVWDWYIIVLALYNWFFTSWYIAFDTALGGQLYGFDWFVTISFVLDILISFRTGYIDYSGNAVFDDRLIADRYLKSYFIIDVLHTFPFHIFSPAIHFGPSGQFVDNCLKVNFLLRSSKVVNSERIDAFISPTARIGKLLFGFFCLAHLFGCIFFFVGTIQTTTYTWIHAKGYDTKTVAEQYIASLYWALTTMVTVGYGDIVPVTVYEQATVIPILMLSALIYATIFGNMAYAIETITSTIRRYQSRMDSVKEFVKVYELPTELQQKLFDYTNAMWSQTKGFSTDEMLSHLPTSVRAEIMMSINHVLIERVPLFKQCSDRFLEAMILRMTSQVCLAGDYIFKEGDKSRDMYFVRTGTVEIIMEVQGVDQMIAEIGSYSDSPYFGEISLLLGETRTASAKAATKCVLSRLSQQDFFEVLSMFPEEENSLRETATIRLEQDIERESKALKKREKQGGGPRPSNNSSQMPDKSIQPSPRSSTVMNRQQQSLMDEESTLPSVADGSDGALPLQRTNSKAVGRLRDLSSPSDPVASRSPSGTPLITPAPAEPQNVPGVQTRLSRLNCSTVRRSVFVANGQQNSAAGGGGVPGSPNTPQRLPSFTQQQTTPVTIPTNTTSTSNTTTTGVVNGIQSATGSSTEGSTGTTSTPSSADPPLSITTTPASLSTVVTLKPILKSSDGLGLRVRHASQPQFDGIAEEDEANSPSNRSAMGHSRRVSMAAEKYTVGAMHNTSSNPSHHRRASGVMAPPTSNIDLDALAALRKNRDDVVAAPSTAAAGGHHARKGAHSVATMARIVAKMLPHTQHGHHASAGGGLALPNEKHPLSPSPRHIRHGSGEHGHHRHIPSAINIDLEDKVKMLEAKINDLTKQMIAMAQQHHQQQLQLGTSSNTSTPVKASVATDEPAPTASLT